MVSCVGATDDRNRGPIRGGRELRRLTLTPTLGICCSRQCQGCHRGAQHKLIKVQPEDAQELPHSHLRSFTSPDEANV